jgi:cytochrome c1
MSIFKSEVFKRSFRILLFLAFWIALSMGVTLIAGKIYQNADRDPDRGAIGIESGEFGEGYTTPVYLDQGWENSDSLWFYTTTQGSVLLPFDFFLSLEQAESQKAFLDPINIDKFRYLPQKQTLFNRHALPVGFAVENYRGIDYVGYTCAACHTGQINYKSHAIRIDGGPSMADMVGFLAALENSIQITLKDAEKFKRFSAKVIELDNDYDNENDIRKDLELWGQTIKHYNQVNYSSLDYGYARLDAFGRIYNRVLQHVINPGQLALALRDIEENDQPLLDDAQIKKVLEGLNETIVGDLGFASLIKRLQMTEPGFPALNDHQMRLVKEAIFNEPNAPVSYPFLWDIPHSDYVQWNGIANNAAFGPLGRNTGEVIGVFAKLDWEAVKPGFSLAAWLTNQENKSRQIRFTSSVDTINLERLEGHLRSLKSPVWPEEILGKINSEKANRGQRLYAEYCQSCHQVIDREDFRRLVTANMTGVSRVGTDPVMAENAVKYTGYSGNFYNTYLGESVGNVVIQNRAPVAQILTAVTRGSVVTPDYDKTWVRRNLDSMYMYASSLIDNPIKPNIKHGDYDPDTTSQPYNSLLAYKARSLNGIWATAPYLHNGSVPSLYDLLLPNKNPEDPAEGQYRPDSFVVGSREFDPIKVGFRDTGYPGTVFDTSLRGNSNKGHDYGTQMTQTEREDLVEYLKTL